MFLINGIAQESLPASDRAVQFGDGCFTTARIIEGEVCMLASHLQRLQEACARLFIPFTQWAELQAEMTAQAQGVPRGVLKVIITRGSGGRGYSAAGCTQPSRILSLSAYPDHYHRWREEGISLTLSPVRLGRSPVLAGIKHLNRLEQVLIRAHLDQTGGDEALVLDSEGLITECCAANLFWRRGREVFTPRLDMAGVNGLMRQFCLAQLARSDFHVVEVHAPEAALNDAEEIVVCNALMPVVPVRQYGEMRWSSRDLYQFLAPLCEQNR